MSGKYDDYFVYYLDDIVIHLSSVLKLYKEPTNKNEVLDLKENNIREHKYIIRMLIKECKSYIINKKTCLNSTIGFDEYLIQKLISGNNKIIIMKLDINKLSIMDYIQIGCIIDYNIFNKEKENFKNIIRKEKIKEINNE